MALVGGDRRGTADHDGHRLRPGARHHESRVPSFVVTLAGLLIWSGVVLILVTQVSQVGTIRIQDETAIGIANDFLQRRPGLGRRRVVIAAFALMQLQTTRSRRAGGLKAKPLVVIGLQTLGLAVVTFAAVWYANKDRGIPKVMVILGLFLVVWSFIATRTSSDATSTRSEGTPRPRAAPASTSTASASPSS